jgi:hypothetical protein
MTILNQKKDVDSLRKQSVQQMTSHSMPKMMTYMQETTQNPKDSISESTKMMESHFQLLKEIKDYEVDEDEQRKKKRKRRRQIDDF